MRTEYDFTEGVRNPYVKKEKKAVTIRLEKEVVDYFKAMSTETGLPYQNLINLYLRDCAEQNRKLSLVWRRKIKEAEASGGNG
ncbi:MAG: BrnA antitoxin family protein [Opitutales bacterium]|nr:BrnA antitoxin family protein [Opitutales bacterium]